MDFNKLYELGTEGRRNSLHVASCCDLSGWLSLYRGEVCPQQPVPFQAMKGASGSGLRDFVSTSWPGLLLISEQVVETLREFSGWTTYPVSVVGKNEEVITGYSGLAVTGRAGPVDSRQSKPREITSRGPEKRPGRAWYGIYFSEDTWDGSDVFTLEGTAMTIVVPGVRAAFEREGITNVTFAALSERRNTSLPTEFF